MRRFLIAATLVVLCAGVVSGAGLAAKEKPGVTPTPASVEFGLLPHGEYTTQTVEFVNTTSYTLQRRSAQMAQPFSTFSSRGCSALAPAGKCYIDYAASWLTDSVVAGIYRATVVQPFVWIDQRGAEHTVTAKVRLAVTLTANQRPTAGNQSVTTSEDTAKTITLTGGDPDGNALSFSKVTGYPEHGTLGDITAVSCAGTPSTCTAEVTYKPTEGYTGSDQFVFKTSDGVLESSEGGWVSITVTPAVLMSVSPAEVDFGERTVGQPGPPVTVKFTNKSDSTLWLKSWMLDVGNTGFSAESSAWMTCYPTAGIAPGGSCIGQVSFVAPSVGTYTSTLSTEWISAQGGPVLATTETPLTGIGVEPTLPALSINDPPMVYSNNNATVTFTVTMDATSASDVTFEWTATDDSAYWGNTCDKTADYTSEATTGTGTITAGQTTTTIAFGTCNNGPANVYPITTPTYFTVTISNPSGATITTDTGKAEIRIS